MSKKREYDKEYKVQAVKFAKNLGSARGAANSCQHAVRLDTKGKEPLCIPTVAASIPVLHIGQSFKNMALCRA